MSPAVGEPLAFPGLLEPLRTGTSQLLSWLDGPLLVYFLLANTGYLLLTVLAGAEFVRHQRRRPLDASAETYRSPLAQPVSVLVPAYNEEPTIVESVRAMLSLRYPTHEVIVCDDGSSDATLQRLRDAFDLVEVPWVLADDVPMRGSVRSVWVPADGSTPLVVIAKENAGRADALNVCLNAARYPLVCMVDADSILAPDALMVVAKPFAEDPVGVAATGGVIRAVNGCEVVAGRVVSVRMPRGWIPRIQTVEYLRSFLIGRSGWSRLDALSLISGAFGVFRRDLVVAVGGFDPDCIGEDYEIVVAIHRHLYDLRRRSGGVYAGPSRVVFVGEPVSWTEVPATASVLARQRRRWHRGLIQVLRKHRRMMFNPRYGRIGMLAMPYYLLFELFAPVAELIGLVLVGSAILLGVADARFVGELLLVSYGYATLLSLAALVVEEFAFARYGRWRDLAVAVGASVAENVGYRQATAWWRAQGLWAELRGGANVWGVMPRQGFGPEGPSHSLHAVAPAGPPLEQRPEPVTGP